MNPGWRLLSHGEPKLLAADGSGRALVLSRKDAALLVYLAVQGTAPSAVIASLLWPDAADRGALNSLRQRVHRLRRDTGARLLEVSEQARLADDLVHFDPADVAALEQDARAWDAPLLGTHDYDDAVEFAAWLARVRKAWADARGEALARIASLAEQQGELARALVYAQRLCAHDNVSEHAHRRLMRLHYLRGDTAAAVAAFEACERSLKDELGLAPSVETRDLLTTIESGNLARGTTRVRPVPTSLLKPPRTVGRAEQQRRIAEALEEGGIAVLVGEAGIGKTRLLQEVLASAGDAAARLYAQARPGDAGVPFGTLQRLGRAVAPAGSEWSEQPPSAADIEALLHAAVLRGVTTFILDDLHFADRASLETLIALVGNERLGAARWLFAHRPIDAGEQDGALLRSLAEANGARWIAVPPLAEPDLADLIDSLQLDGAAPAALASALWRHTGGNPLYALETLRAARGVAATAERGAMSLPKPQNIAHMIDRRLQRLSERALALGRVAALAGPDFSPALAEHALGTPAMLLAGAWAELEAADVLRGPAFAHDLVRDGMLRATPQAIAVHAHRLIAQYLERQAAEPACVAQHWWQAGDHRSAAAAFKAAAVRAKHIGRPREEAQLLAQAAVAFEACGDVAESVACRAHAVAPLLRGEGVREGLAASTRLLAEHGAGVHSGLVHAAHALALMFGGRAADAEAAGRVALARLAPGEEAERMEASSIVAVACGTRGNPGEGLALLQPWLSRLDHVGELVDRVEFCGNYTVLLLQADRPGEAIALAAKHRSLAQEAGDPAEEMQALINAAQAALRRGEQASSIAHAEAALALDLRDEQVRSLKNHGEAVLGFALCGVGRYAEGLERLEAALASVRQHSPHTSYQAMVEDLLALAWLQLGQPARAHGLVAPDSPQVPVYQQVNRWVIRAMLAVRTADARQLLTDAIDQAGHGQGTHVRMVAQLHMARRQDPGEAVVAFGNIEAWARAAEYLVMAGWAAALRLKALVDDGRLQAVADDVAHVEHAVRTHRGTQPYFPEMMLICMQAYDAIGRTDAAQRCFLDASHWLHELALPNIPREFRDGFLRANPANLALSAEASRRLAQRSSAAGSLTSEG